MDDEGILPMQPKDGGAMHIKDNQSVGEYRPPRCNKTMNMY